MKQNKFIIGIVFLLLFSFTSVLGAKVLDLNANPSVTSDTTFYGTPKGGNDSNGMYIEFDGSNDYLNFLNLGNMDGSSNFNISLVFNANSLSSYGELVNLYGENEITMQVYNDDSVRCFIDFRDAGGSSVILTSSGLTTNTKYKMSLIYDTTTGLKLYINGVLKDSNSQTGTIDTTTASNSIGGYGSNYFNGKIYNLTIKDGSNNILYQINASSLSDWSGNGNDAEIGTSGQVLDYIADGQNAWNFDSSIPNNLKINSNLLNNVFSWSLWVNERQSPSNKGESMNFVDLGVDSVGMYSLQHNSNNKLRLYSYTTGWNPLETDNTIDLTNSWNNVIVSRESDGTTKIYVNGNLIKSGNLITSTDSPAGTGGFIGRYLGASTTYELDGKISQVQIYNTALTSSEITDIYNKGAFYNDNIVAPAPTNTSQRLTETVFYDGQIGSTTITYPFYTTVYSGTINVKNNQTLTEVTSAFNVKYSSTNTATCRILIDGVDANSESSRTSSKDGSVGAFYIQSESYNLSAGNYTTELQCKRSGGGSFTIYNAQSIAHFDKTSDDKNIKYNFFGDTYPIISNDYKEITILNSSTNYYNGNNKVMLSYDISSSWNYDSTGKISFYGQLEETNQTYTDIKPNTTTTNGLWLTPENLFDGDKGTAAANNGGVGTIADLTATYILPSNTKNVNVTYKDSSNENTYTIPDSCLDYIPNELNLKIVSHTTDPATNSYNELYCLDGATSEVLLYQSGTSSSGQYIYEVGVNYIGNKPIFKSSTLTRYGKAGNEGSGGLLFLIKDVPKNTTLQSKIFVKSTTSDGSLVFSGVQKEYFMPDEEAFSKKLDQINFTDENWTNLTYGVIDTSNVASSDVVIKSVISAQLLNSVNSTKAEFRYLINGKPSGLVERSFDNNEEPGIITLQYATNACVNSCNITLQGKINQDDGTKINILGGDFLSYLAGDIPFNESAIKINGYQINTNNTIQNFSVVVENGSTFNSLNGTATVFANTQLINFTVTSDENGGYYNKTILNHPITENKNVTLYQAILNLVFKHLLSKEDLNSVNLTSTYYNGVYNTNDKLYFQKGNYSFFADKYNYGNDTENISLNSLDNSTIIFYLSPDLNVSIYDEATKDLFDIPSADEIKVTIVCSNNTGIFEQVINNNQFTYTPSCVFDKLRFDVTYGSETYFRTLPNINQFNKNNFDFSVWLVNLNTSNVVLTFFNAVDLFGDYKDKKLIIEKTINEKTYIITGDDLDIEDKLSAYLLQSQEYTLELLSSNKPTRILGNYFSDISKEASIRLFDLDLQASLNNFEAKISSYVVMTNESNSIKIRAYINGDSNLIRSATFTVRNNTATGNILYQGEGLLTDNGIEWSYGVPDINSNYWTQLSYIGTDGTSESYNNFFRGNDKVDFQYKFLNKEYQQWLFFLLFLILGFTASIASSNIFAILITGLAAFLNILGWIHLADTPIRTAILLGLIALISIGSYIRQKDRGQ